jgi:ribonuclease I
LKGNQVAVICDREDRTSVVEVRICLDKDFNFRDCGSGNGDKCGDKAVLLPVR